MLALDQKTIEEEWDEKNIYVISDVHLDNIPELSEPIAKKIQSFFNYLLKKEDDFHLILNGDVLDFNFCRPDEHCKRKFEKFFGPSSWSDSGKIRLNQVLKIHDWILDDFARILDSGHKITFIPGNHDLDFHWIELQDYLLEKIRERLKDESKTENFRFSMWYYWQKGKIFVEHGHRFDPDNALSHPVFLRVLPDGRLEQSFGTFLNQYFTNFYDPPLLFEDVTIGPFEYVKRVTGPTPWHWIRAWLLYNQVGLMVLYEWVLWFFGRSQFKRDTVFASRMDLLEGNISSRFGRPLLMLERLHFPKYFIVFFATLSFFFPSNILYGLLGLSLFWHLLSKPDFFNELPPLLEQAAHRIGRKIDVKVVSFGHLHYTSFTKLNLKNDTVYANTGTWVFPKGPFTFLAIEKENDFEPQLLNFADIEPACMSEVIENAETRNLKRQV